MYILRRSNTSCFKDRRLKKISLLNKLSLEVTISRIYKTNIDALQIAILNRLRMYYKHVRIVKVANNIYKSTLYCLRVYSTFLTLTKIVLNNNLKLIEEKLRSNKWLNLNTKNNLYRQNFNKIVNSSSKLKLIKNNITKRIKFTTKFFVFTNFLIVVYLVNRVYLLYRR